MRFLFKLCKLSLLLIASLAYQDAIAAPIDRLIFITEQYPPYNYQNDQGNMEGIAIDVLENVFKKLNATTKISDVILLKWSKAYHKAEMEKNTVLFSMARTPAREKLFKWVGPIANSNVVLVAKKTSQIKIKTVKDLKNHIIVVIKDDIGAQEIIASGVPEAKIKYVSSFLEMLKMIDQGQADLMSYSAGAFKVLLRSAGHDNNNYEPVFEFHQDDYYFAVNNKTDDVIIKEFQQAIDQLKNIDEQTGKSVLQSIIQKYIN